jgi:hypothetical protein
MVPISKSYITPGERCFTRVGSGVTHKHYTRLERLAGTNTLAYYGNTKITAVISLMIQAPGYKDMQGTNILAYLGRFEVAKKSKCVCHSKPSHPSLMFVDMGT